MKFRLALVMSVVAGLTLVSGCGTNSSQSSNTTTASAPKDAQVVHVVAEDYDWTLDKTTFKVNKPIEFVLSCREGDHGFGIEGTNVNVPIASGQHKTEVWTPKHTGTYTIDCTKFCGPGHSDMKTTFKVVQ